MSECISCTAGLNAAADTVDGICPATGYQKLSVCVPVIVTPFAHTGRTITKCCGDPIVVAGEMPCPGKKNGSCAFTISQTICVEVPVEFGANAVVGDTFVDCLGASAEDICIHCREEEI
ncbi:MAG: hypothetical protein ACI4SB_01445 [Acutalibacteraceae bacterium]